MRTHVLLSSPSAPRRLAFFSLALVVLSCGAARAQEEDDDAIPEAPDPAEQMLVDADALVIGTEVTTRCAMFDSLVTYLTPVEQVGATLRLREMTGAISALVPDAADRVARMRADAAAIACGDQGLVPFMDFARQVARDTIDIALMAWRDIDIDRCHYFADEDFLAAAERAHSVSEALALEGASNRIAYIEQRAAAWAGIFASNCTNVSFDPVETLPGQIALALPIG